MPNRTEHTLIDRWLATWAHARSIEVLELDGWPVVQVGSRTRETELVCVDPGVDTFAALLRHIDGDPRAMLTVIAKDVRAYRSLNLPPGVRVDRDDEMLMSATFRDDSIPPLAAGLTFGWDVDEHLTTYSVESGDRLAAEGSVAVLDDWATFDNVETTPDFQRQGLGRHVMAALTTQAMGRGATSGVLAASADGRGLYESLGWEPALEMLSLMGT
ncbi:GNAT family N-acetyltransferase [Aeromicrobium sp.]|uniref:GNAT family N-acetyltransferase n=1 Tax=Aeromicrobium sp. TaxID=1871063 RepID=UPI0030C0669B